MFERPKNPAEAERDRERYDTAVENVRIADEQLKNYRSAVEISEEKIAALKATLEREREMFRAGEGDWGPMELKIKERELVLLEEEERLQQLRQSIKNLGEYRDEEELALPESEKDFKRHLN